MKRLGLLLALAACGDPPAAIDAAVEPVADVLTLADLVEGAGGGLYEPFDASANSEPVSAYVVTRAGGIAASGAQLEDVSLLLKWERTAIRVHIDTVEVPVMLPFGTLTAVPAFPARDYDSEHDAFPGAPRWPGVGTVLFATTLVDVQGVAHAYVVSRDFDRIVASTVTSNESAWDEQPPWASVAWVTISEDSPLSLPDVVIDTAIDDRVRVQITEHAWTEAGRGRFYETSLRIEGRSGPLVEKAAARSLDEPWDLRHRTKVIAPPRGQILASRRYRLLDGDQDARVLVQSGDDLVVWRRDSQPTWREELRVPLPRGAEVTVH